ncbi:VOC family protein [Kineococcus sp. GCM10028916]|uniref:VOC family protein n=1 Tax=Kineococcus sp. GCM10028916 TaxID=3273394 RepID=UPI003640E4D7
MTGIVFEGVTMLADDVAGMAEFYEHALGFEVAVREADYVALGTGAGVRLAIFRRSGMGRHTHDHPSFREPRRGQAVELNFACASPEEVRTRYAEVVARGGVAVAEPVERDWGQIAGFFADPEGNVHSLFADLPA